MPYNFYGSWVDDDEPMDDGAGGGQAQVDDGRQGPEIITQPSPVCTCNTTCSKKTEKKPGCPCKDNGKKCIPACLCGKKKHGKVEKPCKNGKPQNDKETDAGLLASGNDRLQLQVEESRKEMKEFLATQDRETLELLVIELACNGNGSVSHIKDLAQCINNTEGEPEPEDAPSWCRCGVCRPMPTEEENKCCGKRLCVTSYQIFSQCCVNRNVLELAIKYRTDSRAEQFDFSTNELRKAAYRQFVVWKYGKLGKGVRKVNPACVVRMVRQAFPSPDDRYMGFKRS